MTAQGPPARKIQVDSPLGRWTQHEWRPAHLAGVVDFLWLFEGRLTHLRERTFPSGKLELIVHFGATYKLVEGVGAERCSVACLTGLQTSPIVIEAPDGPSCVMGVRLHPAGAYAVLARPLSEVTGLTADLQDVVGRAAVELTERCAAAASAEERLRRAAAWVEERVARSTGVDPAIAWIASRIERQAGAAGYYDQPHMNAEFRELGGLTPREFLAANRYLNSVSIAEVA